MDDNEMATSNPIRPLQQLIMRNSEIDRSADSISDLDANIDKLFQNMRYVLKDYSERIHSEILIIFIENLGKFKGDFASINDACKRFSDFATNVNQKLKELSHMVEDIDVKIHIELPKEDLENPILKEGKGNMHGRRYNKVDGISIGKPNIEGNYDYTERKAMSRAADLKSAMAAAALAVAEAKQFLTEAEAQATEMELAAKKAYIKVQDVVIDGQAARVAAEEKRIEEEAKQRAEERARRKTEEDRKAAQAARDAAEKKRIDAEEEKKLAEERARQKIEEDRRAAEAARDAAEKKRIEEEEAKQLAEEQARQRIKVEQETKRQEEQRIRENARKEEERRNPKNWPTYLYTFERGDFDVGIGCIIRAKDASDKFREVDLNCLKVEQTSGILKMAAGEELISNIIELKLTSDDHEFKFDEPFSIAIPYCINKVPVAKEVSIKTLTLNGQWIDLPTEDFLYEDNRETKFAEARSRQFGTFVVVLRWKKDTLQLERKGNKVTSTVDSRISFTCKPGTVKQNIHFSLEIQPIDPFAISDVRTRAPTECNGLIMSSQFVRMSTADKKFPKPSKFNKPLSVTMPLPQCSTKQVRSTANKEASKIASRPTIRMPPPKQDTEEEEIHFLCKGDKTGWIKNADMELIHTKSRDVVAFNMEEFVDGFVLLRTKPDLRPTTVEMMAALLDRTISERYVKLHLRQQDINPRNIIIVCASSNKTDDVLKTLDNEGYQNGPQSSNEIVLEEGQTLFVRFRGNIKSRSGNSPLEFIYNSHMRCQVSFIVEEVDAFAQNGLQNYRGFAQVFTNALVQKTTVEGGRNQSHVEMVDTDILLAELLVDFPKTERDAPTPRYAAPVKLEEGAHGTVSTYGSGGCGTSKFMKSTGPVTMAVLRDLATGLDVEWRDVADQLNIKPVRIQAILRQNVNQETTQTRIDMLVDWAKRMPTSTDKIQILHHALLSCGRHDLAEEIRYRGDEYRKQRLLKARLSHLNQAFVKVANTNSVLDHWQVLAKRLGLSDEVMKRIEDSGESKKDNCLASLEEWKNSAGEKATVPALASELKMMKHYSLSTEVESILG